MKWVGLLLLFSASFLLLSERAKRAREKLLFAEELSRFFARFSDGLGAALETPAEAAKRFSSEPLWCAGFLPALAAGKRLSDALSASALPLPEAVASLVFSFSEAFGDGDFRGGAERLSAFSLRLSETCEKVREETDRRLRLVRTLAVSAAAGVLLLVL